MPQRSCLPVGCLSVLFHARKRSPGSLCVFFYFPLAEVFPAKLVFISFLEANAKGQMAGALEKLGIHPICYSLDGRRPDLTKLDSLLAQLSTLTPAFKDQVA
jgi:hypothetical protein